MPFLALFLGFTACVENQNEVPPQEADQPGSMTLAFYHKVGDNMDLMLDTMLYTNAAGNEYQVTKLEYIVSRFRLHKEGGGYIEFDTAHYRRAGQPATRSLTLTSIPEGKYTKITFVHGLDSATNQPNALPPTQNFNNLAWPSQLGGGYHYMRMNGNYKTKDTSGVFTTHTGHSRGDDGKIHENFVVASLKQSFTVNNNSSLKWGIYMDVNKWYETPHVYDFSELSKPGIMMNQAIQAKLSENGRDVYSIGPMAE